MGSANRLRIVDTGILHAEIFLQLAGTLIGDELHVIFAAKLQTPGGTRLDACRFQPLANPVRTQCALINLLRAGIESGNIEWAAGNTKLAANAIVLIKINDPVGVFHNGAVGGTGRKASGICAVHALVFPHQPLDSSIFALVLIEFDQIPKVPARLGHGLVGVVESGRAEGHVVPLDARHFARFTADAGGGINQFADFVIALHPEASGRSGMARDLFGL